MIYMTLLSQYLSYSLLSYYAYEISRQQLTQRLSVLITCSLESHMPTVYKENHRIVYGNTGICVFLQISPLRRVIHGEKMASKNRIYQSRALRVVENTGKSN